MHVLLIIQQQKAHNNESKCLSESNFSFRLAQCQFLKIMPMNLFNCSWLTEPDPLYTSHDL